MMIYKIDFGTNIQYKNGDRTIGDDKIKIKIKDRNLTINLHNPTHELTF